MKIVYGTFGWYEGCLMRDIIQWICNTWKVGNQVYALVEDANKNIYCGYGRSDYLSYQPMTTCVSETTIISE